MEIADNLAIDRVAAIVNTSSGGAFLPLQPQAVDVATKARVEMLAPEDIAAMVLELVRDPESAGRIVRVDNLPRRTG